MPRKHFFENYYARNVFAYLVVLLIGTIPFAMEMKNNRTAIVLQNIEYFSLSFFIVVLHNRYLFQVLLLKKKIVPYAIGLVATYFVFYYGTRLIMNRDITHSGQIFYFIADISLGISIYLATKYMLERKQFFQTTLMKREIELQQLKSQLNPHFLFNALNNIYSYALHNEKYGSELILKLSDLMRYILDSAKSDTVPLHHEILFIENYLAFEKERLGERCQIIYTNNVSSGHSRIEPLILFPFIENAFKHGADSIQKSAVEIALSGDSESLHLIVKNNIINRNNPSTKIGLTNAGRRLELLYPERHQLKIDAEGDLFIVNLTLCYGNN